MPLLAVRLWSRSGRVHAIRSGQRAGLLKHVRTCKDRHGSWQVTVTCPSLHPAADAILISPVTWVDTKPPHTDRVRMICCVPSIPKTWAISEAMPAVDRGVSNWRHRACRPGCLRTRPLGEPIHGHRQRAGYTSPNLGAVACPVHGHGSRRSGAHPGRERDSRILPGQFTQQIGPLRDTLIRTVTGKHSTGPLRLRLIRLT